MAKYILLKKKSAKTHLLGTQSKPYTVQIDNNFTTNWYLMDEAWLVTNVYIGNKGVIAQSLRATNPDIGPNEIDKFIEIVKIDHPLEHVDYNWNDIPLYATEKSYCDLPLPWLYKSPIKLTREQEKELLGIVQDDKAKKKERMIDWFRKYRGDYGIETRLKRDREIQDEFLAEIFCMVHGFDLDAAQMILYAKETQNNNNPISSFIELTFCCFPFLICGWYLKSKGDSAGNWIFDISLCAFMIIILVSIGLYVQFRKDGHRNMWKEGFYNAFTNIKTLSKIIIALIMAVCIPFCLLLIGNESDSWLVGVLCAVPFFLLIGYAANFLKGK